MNNFINKYYIDILLSKSGFEKDSGSLKRLGALIKKVHYLNINGKELILSFPKYQRGDEKTLGNIVRVFSHSKENLEHILKIFKEDPIIKYMNISNVREFIISNNTIFYEYKKFNIPRVNNRIPSLKANYREIKLTEAEDYPFVIIGSKSTEQKFSLIIEKRVSELNQGKPNSYGLSSANNRLSVPEH